MDIEKRVKELREEISYHSNKYYNDDDPEISDYEFDELMQELKKIEKEFPELFNPESPTQKVGGTGKREAGVLVKHRVPMLSLQDVFGKNEVFQFVEDIMNQLKNPEFVVEPKIDGLSLALRYEDGNLKVAITRGDGITEGEDVTENAKVINDVKKSLKEDIPYLELRGEVYMTNEAFERVNENQELLGKKTFANTRNCAAGTLRQLESKITKERELSMFIFNIQDIVGRSFRTHTDGYEWLKAQGVKVIENYYVCKTPDEVWNAIQEIGEKRGELPYIIDGAVVKINNLNDRELLGSTSKVPKWAIAYKYPPEEKETQLIDVEFSVGRTGRITPTAIFDYLSLCGTKVSRATLHNQDFIDNLDIRLNDTIVVYKSGEIIPKVKEVIKEKRLSNSKLIRIPKICPVCGSHAVREEGTADIKCTGSGCPAQLERHIINFVNRDAMDIKGFGKSYIEALIKLKYIKDISDIYKLNSLRDDLINKAVLGKQTNTDKLLQAIEQSKNNEAYRLLIGLGIPNVGKTASKALMNYFKSIASIQNASIEDLTMVPDIGMASAIAIKEFFNDKNNTQIISDLKELGINMIETQMSKESNKLHGKTFVLTGILPTLDRTAATEIIERNGGKVAGSVSKKTDYVLAGDNAGSKLTKAQELKVSILTERELLDMLNQ